MLDLLLSDRTVVEDTPAQRRRVSRDLAVVILVTMASFVLSAAFELREWLTEVTQPLEPYQIDELPLTFAVLALALAWFAWRRWQQSEHELGLRVAAQRALVEREAQYRTLFMQNLAGNALASLDGELRLCNPAMARVLQLNSEEDAVGRHLGDFYADPGLWTLHRARLARGEKLELPLLYLKSVDGRPVQVIARFVPHQSPGKDLELQVYVADITELQLMQKELAETLNENRMLSQRYLLVQEEERRNLARELHDELGQCLNAIKLDAVAVRDLSKEKLPEVLAAAASIIEICNHVHEVVRSIMQRLRPAALDALGLQDAVSELVNQWCRRNPRIACSFRAAGNLEGLGELINITVYRLVQECLTNIAKHSQAGSMSVAVHHEQPDEVRVLIADDGRGMDLTSKRSGLGLIGLRERVEALSGRLEIITAPGQGMQVSAMLPVPASPRS